VAHGADLKARENRGWTPLLFAVREGQIETVRGLLALGADVNEALIPPAGAVAGAAAAGTQERERPVPPLLRQVPAMRAADRRRRQQGPSALALAVESPLRTGIAAADKGAEANADAQGWTPLHNIT
jgi:ankyrin repeat protein